MYKKRRRRSPYSRIGRNVSGFYTDSKGRIRPITRRKGYLPKAIPVGQVSKLFVEAAITNVLSQAPTVKEIYTAYVIADSLYTNWDNISKLFEKYQRGSSIQSVAQRIGIETARTTLPSIQTEVIWATIGGYIPQEYHNIGRAMLTNFLNIVTTAEIALAKRYLREGR